MKKTNKYRNVQAARMLRARMTTAETLLWKYLKDRRMCQIKFRRQFPVHGFVLDFYCPDKKLGIEIDGGIHEDKKDYDKMRQNIIEDMGIEILRFKNSEIAENIEAVLKIIKQHSLPLRLVERDAPSEDEGQGEDWRAKTRGRVRT